MLSSRFNCKKFAQQDHFANNLQQYIGSMVITLLSCIACIHPYMYRTHSMRVLFFKAETGRRSYAFQNGLYLSPLLETLIWLKQRSNRTILGDQIGEAKHVFTVPLRLSMATSRLINVLKHQLEGTDAIINTPSVTTSYTTAKKKRPNQLGYLVGIWL